MSKTSPKKIHRELKKITQKIVENFQPEKVILYGSWAWGTPGPDSDVDLFVIKDVGKKSTRELTRKIDGSLFPRPFPLDIMVSNPTNIKRRMILGDFFVRDILTKGKVLYEKNT